jgi:hypothetical protein
MPQIKFNNTDNKWSFYYRRKSKGSSKNITVTYKILSLNYIHKINHIIIRYYPVQRITKHVNLIIPMVVLLWSWDYSGICMYVCIVAERWFGFESKSGHSSAWKNGNIFYLFVRLYLDSTYSPMQPRLHPTRAISFLPSRVSSVSPSPDSYCVHHKNQTVASSADGIPNFAVTNLL